MSTGAFLEFLTGMQGSGACWPGPRGLGPGPAAEMLERRREPRLSWNCTAPPSETIQRPPRSRIGGYGSVLRPGPVILRRKPQSGGIQAPVGQVSRGLGARAPRAWGPALQGPGPFPHKNHPNLSNYDFFANLLLKKPGEGVGVG